MPATRIKGRTYEEIAVTATYEKPLPVDIGSATLSVTADGVEIKNDIGNPIPVNDAGGSLTVDGPQITSIDNKLPALSSGKVPVIGPLTNAELRATAVPVSNASLPLPSGASTEAKQDVLITAVDGVETLLTAIDGDLGAPADAAASTDTGTFSLIALTKRALQNWTTLLARIPALVAGRIPVDGSGVTQPVSGPLTDAQLRASVVPVAPNVQQGGGVITASTTRVTLATDGPTVGALTSIDTKTPALSNGRQPVEAFTPARTPTTTSVASSASSVTILGANANRRGVSIFNDSTATLRLSFSTPAAAENAFVGLPAGAFLLLDQQLIITGAIYGIWASENGTAQVTEYV